MKSNYLGKAFAVLLLILPVFSSAQNKASVNNSFAATVQSSSQKSSNIEERNVRANMEFLAGDALQGRGSGTLFEHIAAQYFASLMRQFGIEPAGENDSSGGKTYIQTVNITRNSFAEPPKLSYGSISLEYGKDMLVYQISSEKISGELQKIRSGVTPKSGAILFIRADDEKAMPNMEQLAENAAAIIIEENPQRRAFWDRLAARKVSFTYFGKDKPKSSPATIIVSKEAADSLSKLADGTQIEISGKLDEPQISETWNAVGKVSGSDTKLSSEVILLSAHLDHLGVRENAPGDDKIFNGADDDASGCVAVLELARILAQNGRPKRSVYFAFFGSEEAGGFGSRYFVDNLAFPKENLVANLQFEMLGRPDGKVGADELWLTGYDRSDLGAELARRGAKLVNDPHPDQNFFQRSDNYTLARQGIIAHTVSSFGLHTDYHKASDEVKTIDFGHLTRSINSMVKPIEWLVNSNFKPVWYEGKKP
jgi:hypothetical protein